MGIIIETGTGVSLLKKGDRVVMPFNVADGRCRNCEEGKTAFCTGVNPYPPPFHSSTPSLHLDTNRANTLKVASRVELTATSLWGLIKAAKPSTSAFHTPISTASLSQPARSTNPISSFLPTSFRPGGTD